MNLYRLFLHRAPGSTSAHRNSSCGRLADYDHIRHPPEVNTNRNGNNANNLSLVRSLQPASKTGRFGSTPLFLEGGREDHVTSFVPPSASCHDSVYGRLFNEGFYAAAAAAPDGAAAAAAAGEGFYAATDIFRVSGCR